MLVSDHEKRAIRLNKLSRLLIAVAVLNIFDIISSCCLVQMYGPTVEFNPLMRSLFLFSPVIAVLFKLSMLALYLILIPLAARKNYVLVYRGTQLVVFIYALLVAPHLLAYCQYGLL
jgi:hypothetical protein